MGLVWYVEADALLQHLHEILIHAECRHHGIIQSLMLISLFEHLDNNVECILDQLQPQLKECHLLLLIVPQFAHLHNFIQAQLNLPNGSPYDLIYSLPQTILDIQQVKAIHTLHHGAEQHYQIGSDLQILLLSDRGQDADD